MGLKIGRPKSNLKRRSTLWIAESTKKFLASFLVHVPYTHSKKSGMRRCSGLGVVCRILQAKPALECKDWIPRPSFFQGCKEVHKVHTGISCKIAPCWGSLSLICMQDVQLQPDSSAAASLSQGTFCWTVHQGCTIYWAAQYASGLLEAARP